MSILLPYAKAFLVGGLLCLIGQLLIDYTNLTPARILTSYVVAGVILGALGLYGPFAAWAGAGATVPLTGFGNAIAKGGYGRQWGRRGFSASFPGSSPRPLPASARRWWRGFWCRCSLSPRTRASKREKLFF